jgi:perosamine synthetase
MIKLTEPYISNQEVRAVRRVLKSGSLTQGAVSMNFEKEISNFVGSQHAYVTSSATTGLHLALDALGIGPGDEVIIPDFSFPATANAVIKIGATPVCVDINLDTYCIDPGDVENHITPKTRAIMPVHAFGLCADMPSLLDIAKRFKLKVVEDAACAIGSKIETKHAGTFGDCGVFSFHPRKLITTGEGGAIVTDNVPLSEKIAVLRSHGGVRGKSYFEFIDSGYNFRLSDINAAVGVVQMGKLQEIIDKRTKLAGIYDQILSNVGGILPPKAPLGYQHTYQSYVILLDDAFSRDEVIQEMAVAGIETTLGTYSISAQPYFKKFSSKPSTTVPNSIRAYSQSLTLPLYPTMSEKKVKHVTHTLKRVLERLGS